MVQPLNMRPRSATDYVTYGLNSDAKEIRQLLAREHSVTEPDALHISGREFCPIAMLPEKLRSVSDFVSAVFLRRRPAKICRPVVSTVSVVVRDLCSVWLWLKECSSDKTMDPSRIAVPKPYFLVSIGLSANAEHYRLNSQTIFRSASSSHPTPHTTKVAHLIRPRAIGDLAPRFHESIVL